MQPFRILIVDDHAHAREGIREIIEEYEDFRYCWRRKERRRSN